MRWPALDDGSEGAEDNVRLARYSSAGKTLRPCLSISAEAAVAPGVTVAASATPWVAGTQSNERPELELVMGLKAAP
eukprot:COSAG04_NODE_24364_length_323_cov_0.571429_1_plen_76_part_10